MNRTCIVCKNNRFKTFYPGLIRCQKCRFVSADLHLTCDDFIKLYQRNYFFNGEYSNYLADEKILRKNFKLRIKSLKNFIEPHRHKSLLEIGSAYGFFLNEARDLFENVQGIDITEDGIQYARETFHVNAIQGDFINYDFKYQMFDVVCLWDTIEHLDRPDLYLEKLSQHTETGALIAITTGDIESCNARVRRSKWRLIHPPTHLHYFSKKTLTMLLNQYGFDVIYSSYCGYYRSIEQTIYRIATKCGAGSYIVKRLYNSRIAALPFYINLYDIIYMIAKRR